MITCNDRNISFLEHMVHFDNLENVLKHGLLSHNEVNNRGLIENDISMEEVQARRTIKNVVIGDIININLHDLVSFYFNSLNPMLYKRRELRADLLIILISADILKASIADGRFAVFSDGNAGASSTQFYFGTEDLVQLDFDLIYSDSWNNNDENIKRENKRKKCSEVLVFPSVPVSEILKIICYNQASCDRVNTLKNSQPFKLISSHISVEINSGYFF